MSSGTTTPRITTDPATLEQLMARFAADSRAALRCAEAIVGDGLGLYRRLADGGPQTARELAERTGTEERAVRDWLCGQSVAGYVTADAEAQTFSLTPEQEACFADDSSPTFVPRAFRALLVSTEIPFNHLAFTRPGKEQQMPNQAKGFDQPEETRSFTNGHVDLVEIAGNNVGRINLEPGWRWSESVKPIVGTHSCQVAHVGYAIAGRLHVVMDDGTVLEIKAGDAYEIAPGHDAWVEGGEAYVGVEFESLAAYAKA